jgi:uncharacterized phage protein gp47/JayE
MGSVYFPPSIGPAGLSIPSYQAILALLITNFQAIYGPGVYLGIDSPDYQMLSILALSMSDQSNGLQLAYSNISPATAVGGALDIDVVFNGLAREAPSYSTCSIVVAGTAGIVITNGSVVDTVPGQGYLWDLPSPTIIGSGGTVTVIVTCEVVGNVNAPINGFAIATPTSGWTGVSNSAAATAGNPVETDTQLRTRQSVSTEQPSSTLLAGTIADILSLAGVTRQLTMENPTGSPLTAWPIASGDPTWFGPAHSLTAIVEGGNAQDIADAIYFNKGIGCGINDSPYTGSGSNPNVPTPPATYVTDPDSGQTFAVYFYPPVYIPIYVTVTVNPLTNAFGAGTLAAITAAIVSYLNSLSIGQTVSQSALVAAVMSVAGPLNAPIFDITSPLLLGTTASPSGSVDITMQWPMYTAQGVSGNIVVNS